MIKNWACLFISSMYTPYIICPYILVILVVWLSLFIKMDKMVSWQIYEYLWVSTHHLQTPGHILPRMCENKQNLTLVWVFITKRGTILRLICQWLSSYNNCICGMTKETNLNKLTKSSMLTIQGIFHHSQQRYCNTTNPNAPLLTCDSLKLIHSS